MSHSTFYRKYRSQTFDQIVGQDAVVQTLKNAIQLDRISHAYIFSGPRGTGKTSMARILAKALNCESGVSDTPCLECSLCTRISTSHSVDVIEIDAASNTGVDNIRSLNEQVNFAPVECRTKLYIIDEVHMLSTGAFNALLKTLEEPPSDTVFILATTEPHKIPITIHSRCQHLNFARLSTQGIVGQLRHIATQESITISDDCLLVLAKNAGGCMRDAVSLLDQLVSFKGDDVTLDDVLLMLGGTSFESLAGLIESVFQNRSADAMKQINDLLHSGVNVVQLVQELSELVKYTLFVKLGLDSEIDLDEARCGRVKQLAELTELETLKSILELFSKLEVELRSFPNPELVLQVRLLNAHTAAPVSAPKVVAPPKAAPVSAPLPPSQVARPPKPPVPASKPSPPPMSSEPPAFDSSESLSTPVAPQSAPSGDDKSKFDTFLAAVKAEKGALFAILNGVRFERTSPSRISLILSQNFKFFREKLSEPATQAYLNEKLTQAFGESVSAVLSGVDGMPESAGPLASPVSPSPSSANEAPKPSSVQTRTAAPRGALKINQIVEFFEGTVV